MKQKYYKLTIIANDISSDIWLADDEGFLVQKEKGTLITHLLPGDYVVSFGLHMPRYSFTLNKKIKFTQTDLEQHKKA